MKITVDYDRCTGIGMCESIAPDRFELDDDGNLTIHRVEVEPGDTEADEAVRACPAMALSLVDG